MGWSPLVAGYSHLAQWDASVFKSLLHWFYMSKLIISSQRLQKLCSVGFRVFGALCIFLLLLLLLIYLWKALPLWRCSTKSLDCLVRIVNDQTANVYFLNFPSLFFLSPRKASIDWTCLLMSPLRSWGRNFTSPLRTHKASTAWTRAGAVIELNWHYCMMWWRRERHKLCVRFRC